MNPLAALALNNTLCTKDHTVLVRLREGLENRLNLFPAKLLGGLLANRGEHLVCVVMVVVVVMASAAAMLVMIVMVMLMVVVAVATALTLLIMVVMMMLMVVVAVATAFAVLVVIVMVVMLVVMVVLLFKSVHSILEGILMLHSSKNVLTVKAIPGGSHDNRRLVMLTKEINALGNLLILCLLGVGENN